MARKLILVRPMAEVEADALDAMREEDLPRLRDAVDELERMGPPGRARAADFELYLTILENPHG